MEHTQKVALVTGAGRGIGRAIALRLAADGYRVVVSDIDDSSLAVVEEIQAAGGEARAKNANVADETQVQELVDFCVAQFGRLDACVNNAGLGAMPKPLDEVTTSEWQRAIDVTLTGTFNSMRAELEFLKEHGGGSIVNIASIASLNANPFLTPYGAAKHGVASLTYSAAIEYGGQAIRVNAVAPGPIDTDALASLPEADRAKYAAKVPMQRLGKPEEIAAATAWLISDEAGFVTGTILPVDGGAQHQP